MSHRLHAQVAGVVGLLLLGGCSAEVLVVGGEGDPPPVSQPTPPPSTPSDPPPDPVEPPSEPGGPPDFLLPPAIVAAGGHAEVVWFGDSEIGFQQFPLPPGSVSVPVTLAPFTAVSLHDDSGTLVHSEMMTEQCPHWSGHQPANVLRVPSQFASIQSAVNAASYGDIVYVEPGIYHESVQLKSGIRLVGAGAWQTTIDGGGVAQNLIEFTGAHDVLIRGFRLQGVGLAATCGSDVFDCSGNWYAAAIYADGDDGPSLDTTCEPVSAVITQNIIVDNAIGMMVSYRAQALVRNNLFVGNDFGLVANHLQDRGAALNNVFWQNGQFAIALDAAYFHMFHNLVAHSALGLIVEHVQHGIALCNIFHDAPVQPSGPWSPGESQMVDPAFISPAQLDFRLTAGSPAIDGTCLDTIDYDGTPTDLGAFGTFQGDWFQAPIGM